MTETATGSAQSSAAEAPTDSKDYWDLVLGQLRRRPSVWVSLVLLVLLYATAIYAPFLAGDRPLMIAASDAASYRKAARSIAPVAAGFAELVRSGPASEEPAARAAWEQALQAEHGALAQRAQTMSGQLSNADAEILVQLMEAADRVRAEALAGQTESALEAVGQVQALGKRAKAELEPAAPDTAPEPGRTVALVPNTSYPALDAIEHSELYFMGLWALVLTWPLWNLLVNRLLLHGERERIRRARRTKLLAMALLPLLPLPFWSTPESSASTSAYKASLTSGEMQASRVVMPWIPFGLAEINDGEYLRAPTWHGSSEIGEDGFYVRGARSVRVDPNTGFELPAKPVEVRYGEPERNAEDRHPLGTDELGRDLLARMIWGGRVSLAVGLVSTLFLVLIGTILGALAGYYGGWVDTLISRIVEIFQCFPVFFLILIIVAFIGPSITNIMIVLGVTRWPAVARLVRAEFLRLREQDFVVASEALGVPQRRTIFRHILPNAMGPVLVAATFSVASGILTESALSFLGFGVQLPIPSWGSLLVGNSVEQWWIQIFPGLIIFLTVILYNLFGEGLRDALDPRLKG
ncbi:MAG: ABC transporter permease subunit [Planctomycetota bacterium]